MGEIINIYKTFTVQCVEQERKKQKLWILRETSGVLLQVTYIGLVVIHETDEFCSHRSQRLTCSDSVTVSRFYCLLQVEITFLNKTGYVLFIQCVSSLNKHLETGFTLNIK